MRIVLIQDYKDLGEQGKILEVKDGYARNFLIPKGIAKQVTSQVLKELEEKKLREERKREKQIKRLEELKKRLSQVSITLGVRASGGERMYGAITNIDIARALREEGFDIDRHTIILEEPIKELGVYQVPIRLHPDIEAKIKVWVVKE